MLASPEAALRCDCAAKRRTSSPRRCATSKLEIGSRPFPLLGRTSIADVAVYPGGIRPIRLDGDNGEAVMPNELTRYCCPRRIKLLRSMRGLAKQNDASRAETRKDRTKFFGSFRSG